MYLRIFKTSALQKNQVVTLYVVFYFLDLFTEVKLKFIIYKP